MLIQQFVAIIKNQDVQHIHTSKDNFGSNFQATPRHPAATPRNPTTNSTASTTSSNASRPASAAGATRPRPLPPNANRKTANTASSVPTSSGPLHNRANSAAAAPRPASSVPKGALIRPANAVPDDCPHAKRRRATVVGTSPVKPMLVPKPSPSMPVPIASKGSAATGGTKPPPTMVQPARPSAPAVQNTSVSVSANNVQLQVQSQIPNKRTGPPVAPSAGGGQAQGNTKQGMVGHAGAGRPIAPAQPGVSRVLPTPNSQTRPIAPSTAGVNGQHPRPALSTLVTKIAPAPTTAQTATPATPATATAAAAVAAAATRRTTRASVGGDNSKAV
jgi:hypothetical protein